MPLHVRRQAGPVDHDEKLWQIRQPLPRERSIEIDAVGFKVIIAEQPVNAFGAVADARKLNCCHVYSFLRESTLQFVDL